MDLRKIFEPGGRMSELMPDYECRPQQIEVALAIQRALENKTHCLAEAGTGVGKSIAYLVPMALHSLTGKKVIVSSFTLHLQAQIVNKDIPIVQSVLPRPFTVALMKGRSNYLCLNSLDIETPNFLLIGDPLFERIRQWSRETNTGDVAELGFTFPNWGDICSDQDMCRRLECRYFNECFYYKARKAASEADIVVVNHSLFFSDLAIRMADPNGGVLPGYHCVVFDEAHHIEDTATKAFGIEFSNWRIHSLLSKVRRTRGIGVNPERLQAIEDLNKGLFDIFANYEKQEFFLEDVYSGRRRSDIENAVHMLCTLLDGLNSELAEQNTEGRPELAERLSGLRRICARSSEDLFGAFFGDYEDYVRWVEKARNGKFVTCILRCSPLEVGGLLSEHLWRRVETAVLTSATLATSGQFRYVKARLGISDCVETIQDSPFDFQKQCLLYVPQHLDYPSDNPAYADVVANEMEQIVRASGGRAFLLFTSYRMMNAVYERLSERLPYVLLKQGDKPNEQLVQEFRDHKGACLFGVHSFWEGVDIPGEALSCVVIDKLPFSVPENPIHRARVEAIKSRGGDWFKEYALPQAQMRLKQGFGRLIRSSTDRGVVAILDSRLIKKAYGVEFFRSLPLSPVTHSIEDVRNFFEQDKVIGRRVS